MSWGDPAGASRGGSPTARGKRVPGVEINVPILQTQKKTVGKQLLSSFEQKGSI
ncbi:hypothetical protein P4576_12860 [Peribacillus frigoritolerans]|uniref:hypothetical protein n=1 Tax=Peribacillus frigoritolerans TaxID=450367 RepID=UPI002E20A670|nr:hypothetical protein [Peribacillus frigoritolerans]